jgi:hypothetical protein
MGVSFRLVLPRSVRHEVEAVACRFQHSHSSGHHEKANVRVKGEKELAAAVGLHPTDTQQTADEPCGAGQQGKCIKNIDSALDNLAKHNRNDNLECATALDINTDPTNTRRVRGRVERNEIAAKSGKVNAACGVNHPKAREVTAGSERRQDRNMAERDTHLCFIMFVGVFRESGHVEKGSSRGVVM